MQYKGNNCKNPHFCDTIYKSFALLFRHLGFYMQATHAIGIRQQSMFIISMACMLCLLDPLHPAMIGG